MLKWKTSQHAKYYWERGKQKKTMAALSALRSSLQEEVFDPSDEKLFAFTHVSRAGKKRKPSFLCIAGR